MRIRTIKPEFFLHDGLYELEAESGLPVRLGFIGLWCAADREGRFKWEPRKLGVQILPWDNVEFSRVLHALATRGFIRCYASEGCDYGVIPSFTAHQVINNREKESDLPEPTEYKDCDACPTRAPRVPHAGKAEGKGREGKGTRNGRVGNASATDADFLAFWNAYPKRKARAKAFDAWRKTANDRPDVSAIIAAIDASRKSEQWRKEGGQFIPLPATWLNGGCWDDELEVEVTPITDRPPPTTL
jgi:hypothetical protein